MKHRFSVSYIETKWVSSEGPLSTMKVNLITPNGEIYQCCVERNFKRESSEQVITRCIVAFRQQYPAFQNKPLKYKIFSRTSVFVDRKRDMINQRLGQSWVKLVYVTPTQDMV